LSDEILGVALKVGQGKNVADIKHRIAFTSNKHLIP
jgi:hypothetical protein